MLRRASCGFGVVASTAVLHREQAVASTSKLGSPVLHHPAQATSVIFLYMDGGVSQVDSFDPKPRLERDAGKDPRTLFKVEATQFNSVGTLLPGLWTFRRYGQSGIPISDLFPCLGSVADELAVIRSMTSDFPEHTNANFLLHTGHGLQGRPSMGAWTTYGLGSVNDELPGYMVINGGTIRRVASTISRAASCRRRFKGRSSSRPQRAWPTCVRPTPRPHTRPPSSN